MLGPVASVSCGPLVRPRATALSSGPLTKHTTVSSSLPAWYNGVRIAAAAVVSAAAGLHGGGGGAIPGARRPRPATRAAPEVPAGRPQGLPSAPGCDILLPA